MKIINLLIKIANDELVPEQIKACGQIWNYEESFGQYKNSNFQELIKYLSGYYDNYETGFTYKAIFNYEVEILDAEYTKTIKEQKKQLLNKLAKHYDLEVVDKLSNGEH